MAKIGIFKKVAALATAIAIVVCFAVTAGAVEVTTFTSYVDGAAGDILVEVTIAGDDIVDKSVSYYAFDEGGSPVYIDQIEGGSSEIFFDYVTSDANLNSDVKIGYTGASAAKDAKVEGNTVTWGDAVVYIPTEATEATVTFATEATSLASYTADGASIVGTPALTAGESITVVLESISGPVTLTIETVEQATARLIDSAFVVSNGHDDISTAAGTEGAFADTTYGKDLKLTAIAKVTGADVYGVIVSESESYTADDKFQAAGKTANGFYAVQLIDIDGDEYELLDRSKTYHVAAYAGDDVVSGFSTEAVIDLTAIN